MDITAIQSEMIDRSMLDMKLYSIKKVGEHES